ncbi:hypothetical protein O0L34_g1760 [Tuta absoluta]|nr:hypothetical protein O0L34_g1760 [Tuta absoluta]
MFYKCTITILVAFFCCTSARVDYQQIHYPRVNWEYNVQGFTSEGQPCLNNCIDHKCVVDFDGHETECLVTNTEVPKHFTRFGKRCLSNCDFFGWNYKWCIDSPSKHWDHCNTGDDHVSIWEQKCIGKCTKQFSGYYWCKVEGGWQYCAPPREGADMITEIPLFDGDNGLGDN